MATAILDLTNDYADGDPIDEVWLNTVADELEFLGLTGWVDVNVAGSADVTPDEADDARGNVLKLSGTLTADIDLILPAWAGKRWVIVNASSGAYTITAKTAAGAGTVVQQGYTAILASDGTDILRVTPDVSNAGLSRPLGLIMAGVVSSPVTTVQNLANGNTVTLPSGGRTKRLSASGGAVTGIILTAGSVDGQEIILFNIEASNSITFAAAGTSNVADGTSAVIAALRALVLVWDATSSRWYRTG